MHIEISEYEMIERFVDGLKRSASRSEEFIKADLSKKPQIFVEFMEGIKVAAGSAHQLAHAQSNPKWLSIRDFLEKIIDIARELPPSKADNDIIWMSVKTSLEGFIDTGRKLATAKAMTRQEVLTELNYRSLNPSVSPTGLSFPTSDEAI